MIGIITARAPEIFKISVVRKVQRHYVWDYFNCRESFVRKFLKNEMKWTLRRSTRPGKKIPDGVTSILTDAFLRLVYTITENSVAIALCVNTDQTMVIYAAGASETYAPKGSKQVDVVGKDEKRGFTVVVGISMSGELLPFQVIYVGSTPCSLPTAGTPDYLEATGVLEFQFGSGGTNHWSTLSTMQSYVTNILAPYFECHKGDPNQICIWQIDCWSVHRSEEFRSWMYTTYPWIRIHYVPANCTGLFQPCDVGIQRVLKLAIRRSALQDIINNTMEQLGKGIEPAMVTFEKGLPAVRNQSVRWLVNGYKAINKPELIQKVILKNVYVCLLNLIQLQAFQLCSTGQDDFNLSYESLTSKKARKLLMDRISESQEFYKSLKRGDKGGEEMDHEDSSDSKGLIYYDEIDSSKTIKEAVQDVLKSTPAGGLSDIYADKEEVLSESDAEDKGAGINLDTYITDHFSMRDATNRWMEWDCE
jgi:hypothetical protein